MVNLRKSYAGLCQPAKLYIVLFVIGYILRIFQNYSKPNEYNVGGLSIPLGFNNLLLFAFEVLFAVIWAWVLNKFCRWGWTPLSWFLVLWPFIAMLLVFLGLAVGAGEKAAEQENTKEGFYY